MLFNLQKPQVNYNKLNMLIQEVYTKSVELKENSKKIRKEMKKFQLSQYLIKGSKLKKEMKF